MRIESPAKLEFNREPITQAKQLASNSWCESSLCSPAVTLWSWIKSLFSWMSCSKKKEIAPIALSLKILLLPELKQFNEFVKENWPSLIFRRSYKAKWTQLDPKIREALTMTAIDIFQKRADASSMSYTRVEVIEIANTFINNPGKVKHNAEYLVRNNKTEKASAEELLYEVLDTLIAEWNNLSK